MFYVRADSQTGNYIERITGSPASKRVSDTKSGVEIYAIFGLKQNKPGNCRGLFFLVNCIHRSFFIGVEFLKLIVMKWVLHIFFQFWISVVFYKYKLCMEIIH